MTCKDLMTSNPAVCVPEDNVVRAAMLMKQHDVGSVPVVEDRESSRLIGIVTDRDITLRVVAEQRDYYSTSISSVMSGDPVTCREDDDYEAVLKAMTKKQIRRVPVVDSNNRLLGIVSQADVARGAHPEETGEMVDQISEPVSNGEGGKGVFSKASLMVAGGLGLGAGLLYLLDPEWAKRTVQHVTESFRDSENG